MDTIKKNLIINADDFGMSREVNEGIKLGIEAGIITSVSLMVNMPFFESAMTYLKKHPEISVGLHFNITEGFPIQPRNQTTTLTREGGHFFYWTFMIFNLFLKKIEIKEIEGELAAQFKILKQYNIPISHIDSHHHIHLYPEIFKVVTQFAEKNKVNALRCRSFNPSRFFYWLTNPPTIKQFVIILFCILDSTFFSKSKHFYEVNNLYDIAWVKDLDVNKFIAYLNSLPEGTTEIICHPAILSKTGNEKFLSARFKGLSLLLDSRIKKAIKKAHIKLIGRVKNTA